MKLSPLEASVEAGGRGTSITDGCNDNWRHTIEGQLEWLDRLVVTTQCRCRSTFLSALRHLGGPQALATAAHLRQSGKTSPPSYDRQNSTARMRKGCLMTACTQPGCTGRIVDGYCDVCGSPAGAVPFVPAAVSATSPAPAVEAGLTGVGRGSGASADRKSVCRERGWISGGAGSLKRKEGSAERRG